MLTTTAAAYLFLFKGASLVVRSLWRGPDNTHGFTLGRKFNRKGWATAQTPNELAVSGVSKHVQPHYYHMRQLAPCHRIV